MKPYPKKYFHGISSKAYYRHKHSSFVGRDCCQPNHQSEMCQNTYSIAIKVKALWQIKVMDLKLILLCCWHFCMAWSWRHRKVTAKRLARVNRDCFIVSASEIHISLCYLFYIFQDWIKTSGAKGKAGKRSSWLCHWRDWISAWYGRWWNGPQLCQSEPLSGAMHFSKCLQISISPSSWTTCLPSGWTSTVSRQRPLRGPLCQGQQAISSSSPSWQVILVKDECSFIQ